ncbi:plasmid mobilization protein [Streptococcus pyogenes]|uniref:plasmid mobilization protein n=1 Tax=Streptococcus pyogenes TaxID=1314 RepID=UPI0010A1C0C0|nr:hypothetical protein [Streptococcus pyogenes]VHM21329.1 Uncharacterised protein [Streptococcus pyogenes]
MLLWYTVYMAEKRTEQINVRLTKEEKESIFNKASEVGKKASDYIREKALYESEEKNVYKKDIQKYLQKIDNVQEENAGLLQKQTEFLELISKKEDTNRELLNMFKLEQEKNLALVQDIEDIKNRSFSQKLRDLFSK